MALKGKLYGLGVGPGDPELITLKALRLLKSAPVVAYHAAKGKRAMHLLLSKPTCLQNRLWFRSSIR